MRTSEVAKQAGVNPQTLRYYERRGILPMPERTPSGYRDYPDSAVSLVRFVKHAQSLGYSLEDIEQLLQLADGGGASCAKAKALTAGRIADLDRRIAELHRMRRCLADLGAVCRGPGPGQLCRVMVQTVDTIDGTGVDRSCELCGCPSS